MASARCGIAADGKTSHQLLELEVHVSNHKLACLIDSGATHSFIDAAIVAKHDLPILPCPGLAVTLADGSEIKTNSVCKLQVHFAPTLMHEIVCHVVPNLTSALVLGIDWLTAHQPVIDWPNYTVSLPLPNKRKHLMIPGLAVGKTTPTLVMCSAKVACKEVAQGDNAWLVLVTPD